MRASTRARVMAGNQVMPILCPVFHHLSHVLGIRRINDAANCRADGGRAAVLFVGRSEYTVPLIAGPTKKGLLLTTECPLICTARKKNKG